MKSFGFVEIVGIRIRKENIVLSKISFVRFAMKNWETEYDKMLTLTLKILWILLGIVFVTILLYQFGGIRYVYQWFR
jgi:hypothetical protein